MCGTSGADVLLGQGGNDFLVGGGGADTMHGGDGIDVLEGNGGNDILNGGPGGGCKVPLLLNTCGDKFVGSQGNDTLLARDGSTDQVSFSTCGSGTDSFDWDLKDLLDFGGFAISIPSFVLASGCESVTVGAVNEGPNVIISRRSLRVGADGRAKVSLTCPATLLAPCAGTLTLGRSEDSQGAPKAYSIDQGTKDKVAARLSRRDRRKLHRSDEITATVISVEEGEFGEKTTVQTLTAHGKRHT